MCIRRCGSTQLYTCVSVYACVSLYMCVCIHTYITDRWMKENYVKGKQPWTSPWVTEIAPPWWGGIWCLCVCKHVCICLVCLGRYMSMNFTGIQFSTPRCRFLVPVLQPSSRQPAHLLKHNMHSSVGALGWSVGRGQPLAETTCYKQSLPLKFYFHSVFGLNVQFWCEREEECV